MPTGYTDGIYRGEITELKDFAAICARGFVAFAHQKDEPLSNALRYPDRDDYYSRMLVHSFKEQERWSALSEEEKYAQWSQYFDDAVAAHDARLRSEGVVRERYENMIASVESVDVPEELTEFKNFMLNQLNDSLKFDTAPPSDVAPMDYVVWCENTESNLSESIAYYTVKVSLEETNYLKKVAFIDAMAETFGFEVERP